ncbi:MAG: PorT family protein [Candidatus Fibromonas sp.]|jgi:hypothetical protein|nr:PorT family protein [Candidatus Fibromonas sp.]
MSIFKRIVIVAVFLCAATVVNAEKSTKKAGKGMKIGARFGYSMQSVYYDMGMLGLRAGLEADIPVGPAFLSPEIDFLYRNNWNVTYIDEIAQEALDGTQPEFAISIPLMVKFILGSTSFIAVGAQIDIPIAAMECFDDDCISMDGRVSPYSLEERKRAVFDAGVVIGYGYVITPNLALDVRYLYGLTPHHRYKNEAGISGIKSNPMSSYGVGVTYFFL